PQISPYVRPTYQSFTLWVIPYLVIVDLASETLPLRFIPNPLSNRWLKSTASSQPSVRSDPKLPFGAPVPNVAGTPAPGTIIFSVSRRYQSNVIPTLLDQNRVANPSLSVVMSCHVMEADTAPGVPTE